MIARNQHDPFNPHQKYEAEINTLNAIVSSSRVWTDELYAALEVLARVIENPNRDEYASCPAGANPGCYGFLKGKKTCEVCWINHAIRRARKNLKRRKR